MATFSKDYLYELFQKPSRESFREYFQNSTGEMHDLYGHIGENQEI
ncbi:MAG: hypothetical protein PHW03_09220 [Eubacteriales bacterium]|nr:hypothetical protein [Eubacteriales bacterium]